jgi:hypothetical protein
MDEVLENDMATTRAETPNSTHTSTPVATNRVFTLRSLNLRMTAPSLALLQTVMTCSSAIWIGHDVKSFSS